MNYGETKKASQQEIETILKSPLPLRRPSLPSQSFVPTEFSPVSLRAIEYTQKRESERTIEHRRYASKNPIMAAPTYLEPKRNSKIFLTQLLTNFKTVADTFVFSIN